jgi:hypothetical protein
LFRLPHRPILLYRGLATAAREAELEKDDPAEDEIPGRHGYDGRDHGFAVDLSPRV